MSTITPFRPDRSVRPAHALGALASSVLTLGALFTLFHHAAPAHWRADDAVLQMAAAECKRPAGNDSRLRCMDEVLARHHAADGQRLAAAGTR